MHPDGPVTILCGKGNNGGDGLVVARLLRGSGRHVAVVCATPPQELAGDALANLERLPGPAPLRLDGSPWGMPASEERADVFVRGVLIVDALLGTGFQGEPRGAVGEAIAAISRSGAPVVSIDVPSGVDASSGAVAGAAVRASLTVTFHAAKPGLWISPGKAHAGALRCIDIGIPRGAPMAATVGLIEPRVLGLLAHRGAQATKFSSGQVVVAGGSRGLTGAPAMAGEAAMRAGAGYVTACVPACLQDVIASCARPELMTRGLPDDGDGSLAPSAAPEALGALRPGGALLLGPGLGREAGALQFARALALEADAPMVIDADGLNAHAGRLADLRQRSAPTVLTPHAGELARLLGGVSAEIERERLRHVRDAAERCGAVVVLKGDDTLIADPSGRVAVSAGASPALATAGTGDVLGGVIAALLAQGQDAFTASAAGVWLHAEAGRHAALRQGAPEGVIASDVIAALPAARAAGDVAAGARAGEPGDA